jgi:hypothetical protein
MSPSTESPSFAEALPTDTDPSARTFPGRVRGQRLEITSADLTMYSAITGRSPSREERERALTWSEADPMNEDIDAANENGVSIGSDGAVLTLHEFRPWHPAAISLRLREIWFNGLTLRMPRPQVGVWVRRVSNALQQGRRRVTRGR